DLERLDHEAARAQRLDEAQRDGGLADGAGGAGQDEHGRSRRRHRCARRQQRLHQAATRGPPRFGYDDASMVARVPLAGLELLAAYAIFLGSYLVFAIGKFPGMKIDRPGAAIIGAVLMVAFRIIVPLDALRFIDFSTIVLLFSMMLIVVYL